MNDIAGPNSVGRAFAAGLCLVLAAVLTVPAVVAYWGHRTLTDTERYVATVEPLIHSPKVQGVLTDKVTGAINEQVDVEGLVGDAFAGVSERAPRAELLVGPLSAAIDGAIEREVRGFFASDAFAEAWSRVNARAQQMLVRILEGRDGGAVSLQGDEVVLDVSEVVTEVQARLVDRGLTVVENAPIPQTDREIVLVEAPRLKQWRTIYAFGNPVAMWLLPVVGALYLGAFVLARRRPRMAVAIGVAIVVSGAVLALTLTVGRELFDAELSGTEFGPASTVFYETMAAYLSRARVVMVWLGLALLVAGWFAGSNRYGTATRAAARRGLERAGAAVSSESTGGAGRWVASNVRWLRVLTVVVGVVILFWGQDVSPQRWWWTLALVVVVLAVWQLMVGVGRGVSGSLTDGRPGRPVLDEPPARTP